MFETLLCHAIIGRKGGKQLIKRIEITAEFIQPLVQFSKHEISFRIEKVCSASTLPHFHIQIVIANNENVLRVYNMFEQFVKYEDTRVVLYIVTYYVLFKTLNISQRPEDVLSTQEQVLEVHNMSILGLEITAELTPPFYLKAIAPAANGSDRTPAAEQRVSSLRTVLDVGATVALVVLFDPCERHDFYSRESHEKLTLRYAGHPHIVCCLIQSKLYS